LTCGKQAGRQRQYSQSTRLHLDLLPYRRRLFGRFHNLRRKKATRASEVRELARHAFCGSPPLGGGSKNIPSTMRAKKRTPCAAGWLRQHCRFWTSPRELLLRGRALDLRSGHRSRRAAFPQAVDATYKRRRSEQGRRSKAKKKRTARSRGSRTWAVLMPEGAPSYTPPRHCLDDAEPRLTDG